jgi:hypothetical protein
MDSKYIKRKLTKLCEENVKSTTVTESWHKNLTDQEDKTRNGKSFKKLISDTTSYTLGWLLSKKQQKINVGEDVNPYALLIKMHNGIAATEKVIPQKVKYQIATFKQCHS